MTGRVGELESWREGPPRALKLLVFRQTYDVFDEPILKQLHVPDHVTLETVGAWLKQRSGLTRGDKFTTLSVATEDVYRIDFTSVTGFIYHKVESTVY